MNPETNRRSFLAAVTATAGTGFHTAVAAKSGNSALNQLSCAVMGVNGRGSSLARGFSRQKGVVVSHVCDVDSRAIGKGKAAVKSVTGAEPVGIDDFRKALDETSVDILVIAAPNHWHGPAAILGMQAGKHVYVEKPCSHTPREGELMVANSIKHQRVCTMGTQRRSTPGHTEAIQKIHAGVIGNVLYSRCWYANRRGPIGKGKPTAIPSWLDFNLWQGPCTEKPYKDNLVHYNWHWHWHWGNGELGNNGVHAIDIARWGMQVDFPTRVVSAGGRYRFADDQETADTHVTSFEFGKKLLVWEGLSWSPKGTEATGFGVSFHGDKGTLILLDKKYSVYDIQNKLLEEKEHSMDDTPHFDDFLDCIRNGGKPNADIAEAHKSTLLCHLGNIAHRTGQTLETDSTNGHLKEQRLAAHWSKEYRKGWEPTV
ncbi:MAG: Gfo/Idh/MocA family oxidoreductase [Planctomycetota bacterium]|nr:Gfo/Idh/MocA family oxidoreductase [Planctomycetota bacterium]